MLISTQQFLVLAAVASLSVTQAKGHTIKVNGTDDPYLANQPSGTNCCSGDTAPTQSPVLAAKNLVAGNILTIKATGAVGYQDGDLAPSPDGEPGYPISMIADYGTGVSGPLNVFVDGLVGVFTNGTPPTGPAPAQLDSGVTFKKLSPGLNQIFWIGDGLTGTGTGARQQFLVPTGATSLYLGTVDGGGWFNNPGQILVKITVKKPSMRSVGHAD